MREKITHFTKRGQQETADFVSQVTTVVNKTTSSVDTYIAPVRSSVLERFPVLFSLLVTFGATTTFLGFEKIIEHIDFLNRHPFVVLILGMSILAFTGTIYKKLQ